MRERRIEFEEVQIPLRQPDSLKRKLAYSPAGKVPILIDGDLHIWESLAIVDYLAEKFPEKQLWPLDREARALARNVSAEMHAGFSPPIAHAAQLPCSPYVAAGEFLFGEFTAADAMFAPVASRFQTYGVELAREEAEYAQAILALSALRDWMEAARGEPWKIAKFDQA